MGQNRLRKDFHLVKVPHARLELGRVLRLADDDLLPNNFFPSCGPLPSFGHVLKHPVEHRKVRHLKNPVAPDSRQLSHRKRSARGTRNQTLKFKSRNYLQYLSKTYKTTFMGDATFRRLGATECRGVRGNSCFPKLHSRSVFYVRVFLHPHNSTVETFYV